MTWFARLMVMIFLTTMFALLATGCTIDQHIEKTIKIDDPFASESEQQFVGLILNYWKLPDGESTLVTFPNGKSMLIDTGSETDAETLLSYLSEHKITKLDYVVLTNDLDNHVGGYKNLEKNVQIQTILMPKPIADSIRQAVPIATDKNILMLTDGQRLPIDQNVSLLVLHPSEHTLLSPQDNSLVFQLKHDQLRFLFTGGVGEAAEAQLLRRHKPELPA
ncbi:MAG: ComEC/Rec2 family competence protein, partial [Clostridia bacterium]